MSKNKYQPFILGLFRDCYFASRQSFCAYGRPDPSKDKPGKKGMSYMTLEKGFSVEDVKRHLDGQVSIVAIPLLDDSTSKWGCIDLDKGRDFEGLELDPRKLQVPGLTDIFWEQSKSGGWHGFVFWNDPQPAVRVIRFLRDVAEKLGFPKAEVFPKQAFARAGNGVNLPFFGRGEFPVYTKAFDPVFQRDLREEWDPPVPEPQAPGLHDEAAGYWSEDALLAMLEFYAATFEGFEFEKMRGGFAVPCPGHMGSWDDGTSHTEKPEDKKLSPDSIVFLKDAWPKFMCLHAHCNGGCGYPKKTINDFRSWWDPLRVWDIAEWLDEKVEKLDRKTLEGIRSNG